MFRLLVIDFKVKDNGKKSRKYNKNLLSDKMKAEHFFFCEHVCVILRKQPFLRHFEINSPSQENLPIKSTTFFSKDENKSYFVGCFPVFYLFFSFFFLYSTEKKLK